MHGAEEPQGDGKEYRDNRKQQIEGQAFKVITVGNDQYITGQHGQRNQQQEQLDKNNAAERPHHGERMGERIGFPVYGAEKMDGQKPRNERAGQGGGKCALKAEVVEERHPRACNRHQEVAGAPDEQCAGTNILT